MPPEDDLKDLEDWNAKNIAEFRENGGHVGGQFEGAPMLLLHHVGRKSGKRSVAPMMYLADDSDPETVYVIASKAGLPTNPAWYFNITTAGEAEIEIGTEAWPVAVEEITGDERDRLYAIQAKRYPGFADYEKKAAGIRTIPVIALRKK